MTEPLSRTIACPNPDGEGTHNIHYYEWPGVADENAAQNLPNTILKPTQNHPKTPLICVHGLTRLGSDFFPLAEALSPCYRVISVDVAGRGKSDRLKNPAWYNNGVYALDFLYIINSLALENVHWLGTSMGGLIGMIVAATAPEKITKMVINDIGPFIPKQALLRIGEYVTKEVSFDSAAEAEAYLRLILAPWGITDEQTWKTLAEQSFITRDGRYYMHYDPAIGRAFLDENGQPKLLEDADMWPLWDKIACPVLLLRGAKSDILPKSVALEMTTRGPKAQMIEFPGIGHAPALMDASQIGPIKQWLLAKAT